MASKDTRSSARPLTQPRTQQACQRCRLLKARCLTSDQQGICQRCLDTNRECTWPENQQRTKLPRGPSRISQVEKKIDGLVASIGKTQASEQSHIPAVPQPDGSVTSNLENWDGQSHLLRGGIPSPIGERTGDEASQAVSSLQLVTDIHDFNIDPTDIKMHDDSIADRATIDSQDPLTQILLAHQDADKLLEQYRPMALSFPFVPINPNTTAQELCRRKPMLLLAVMATASWADRKLQAPLEQQYRKEIANRALVQPRKNIALLQSILVYLAWYHYSSDPNFQNEALLQMAIGLTIDLKLDPRSMPHLLPARDVTKRVRYGKDGHRALLGCYYLSSITANSVRRSNLFTKSSHMAEIVKRLVQDSEYDSDHLIPSMISIRYLDDQIYEFLHPSSLHATHPQGEHILSQLGTWEICIRDWKEEAKGKSDSHLLSFSYPAVEMELYHSTLRHLCKPPFHPQSVELNKSRKSILTACLEAGKLFLDTLMSVPTEDYPLIPFTLWLPFPRVIITLAMFTSPSDHHLPEWDVKAAQDRVRLDLYLESLCFRMQSLTTFNPLAEAQPDFWFIMKTVLQSVGKWYKNIAKRDTTDLARVSASREHTNHRASWNPYGNNQELHPSSAHLAQSQSGSSLAYTPESATSSAHSMPHDSTQFRPVPYAGMCPMMNTNTGFDMDQFMNMGFWGDGFGDFDTMNFDLPS